MRRLLGRGARCPCKHQATRGRNSSTCYNEDGADCHGDVAPTGDRCLCAAVFPRRAASLPLETAGQCGGERDPQHACTLHWQRKGQEPVLRRCAQKRAQIPCGTLRCFFPWDEEGQTSRRQTSRYGPDAKNMAPILGQSGRGHSQRHTRRRARWCCSVEKARRTSDR